MKQGDIFKNIKHDEVWNVHVLSAKVEGTVSHKVLLILIKW